MKLSSSAINETAQMYQASLHSSTLFKQSSTFQKGFGLGFGFNSPKNDGQKIITLSTRITTDITRSPIRSDKNNMTGEFKNSKVSLDSPTRQTSTTSTSSAFQGETPKTDKLSHIRNYSHGNASDKKKSSSSTASSSGSKQPIPFKRSTSQVIQDIAKTELVSSRVKKGKITIDTEEELAALCTRSQSTKYKNYSEIDSTKSVQKNKSNRIPINGPIRLLTTSSDWQADVIPIGQKMQTAPNEDRLDTVSSMVQRSKHDRLSGSIDFFNTYANQREVSREGSNDQSKERNLTPGNRKIGFTPNGQLQYVSRAQGAIKPNALLANTVNNWFSSVSPNKEKPSTPSGKYDYRTPTAKEDGTKLDYNEKRVNTKQSSLKEPAKVASGRAESKNGRSNNHRTNSLENENRSKENKTPSKEATLQGFVTKVSRGDIMGSLKRAPSCELKPSPQEDTSKLTSANKASNLEASKDSTATSSDSPLSVINKDQMRGQASNESKSAQIMRTGKTEVKAENAFIYYMSNLEKYHKEYSEFNYFCQIYREHFIQSFQALAFCRFLKPVDQKVLASKKMTLSKRETHKDKKTLIFDLDETLIHCNESADIPSDVVLPIKFPHGETINAGINIRPHAREILKELSQFYEIIVFTASHSCYANVILDHLDPEKRYIHHRLFREHCVATEEGVYIKDLRVFGNRSMQNMIIVDNAAYSFGYQISNGIPIIPYYDNKNDQELKHLVPYLKFLSSTKDPREINKITFKMHAYSQYASADNVLQSLIFQE